MDFRAVIIFLCMLTAQSACGPVGNEERSAALNSSVQEMRDRIGELLGNLTTSGELPNNSCPPLTRELVGPEQQPITAHRLSTFRCQMLEMSKLILKLKKQLRMISQSSQSVEKLISGPTASECKLPTFEQKMCSHVYVKHLLQLLDQQLSKAQF